MSLKAQSTIPNSRLGFWNNCGAEIKSNYTDSVNILDLGAVGNGIFNCSPIFQNAINARNNNLLLIYVPAGVYNLESVVNVSDSIIIRGEGAATHFKINHSDNGFNANGQLVGPNFSYTTTNVARGTMYIIDAVIKQALLPNDFIELYQLNGSWDTNPATWAQNSLGQIIQIDTIINDTIFFTEPLVIDIDITLYPQIRKLIPRKDVGFECFKIEKVGQTAGAVNNFSLIRSYNCWLKGIESDKSIAAHCFIYYSLHCSVIGSYFHNAFIFDGTGTRGYGIAIGQHTTKVLVENNCFDLLRHAMILKEGASDNIIAYNYSKSTKRSEFPADGSADISLHGHYPHHNLIEGNNVQTIWTDDAWGTSGPYNTIFRNRTNLYGILITNNNTNSQNYVGNEITNTSGLFGQYVISTMDNFLYGNNDGGVIKPTNTSLNITEKSYFLENKPLYWGNLSFPNIGTATEYNQSKIPAQLRFENNTFIDCNVYNPADTNIIIDTPAFVNKIEIALIDVKYLNGQLTLNSKFENLNNVFVYDLSGKEIFQYKSTIKTNYLTIPLSLRSGFYIVRTANQFVKFVVE